MLNPKSVAIVVVAALLLIWAASSRVSIKSFYQDTRLTSALKACLESREATLPKEKDEGFPASVGSGPVAAKPERRILNTVKRFNFRGDLAGDSEPPKLIRATHDSMFFGGRRLHPDYHIIIDAGAFDGHDWSFHPFKMGYTVVAFELNPVSIDIWHRNSKTHGIPESDITTITYKSAEDVVGSPLKLPTRDEPPHIFFIHGGASDKNEAVSVQNNYEMGQVARGGVPNTMVMRIDDIVPPTTKVFILKIDTQGHECHVLKGAQKLLESGNVYTLLLEFSPGLAGEQQCDSVAMLHYIYDLGYTCFDLNTHPNYIPLNRPSDLEGFTKFLLDIPTSVDLLHGWDDLMCQKL